MKASLARDRAAPAQFGGGVEAGDEGELGVAGGLTALEVGDVDLEDVLGVGLGVEELDEFEAGGRGRRPAILAGGGGASGRRLR